MSEENLIKLAEAIRDGRATKEEKLEFFKTLNSELVGISEILKEAPQKDKNENS